MNRARRVPGAQQGGGLTNREWKIVEAMYRLMEGKPRIVTYEDIVVKAWELYPDQFGLRGYSDRYPDASDVHKPLYLALRSRGWVSPGAPGQKQFKLTAAGWERARARFAGDSPDAATAGRASRTTELEIRYLLGSDAFRLHQSGQHDDILDTDVFSFYRTSVRAKGQEFSGRLAQVRQAIDEGVAKRVPGADELKAVDAYLRERFAELMDTMIRKGS